MKTTLIMLASILLFTACFDSVRKYKGHAVIVDNFNDRNPLEGVYIEMKYTNVEGGDYKYLDGVTTDKNGYFELNTSFNAPFFGFDSDAYASVYSDTKYTDTLGFFRFQFNDDTFAYLTIHLDTFALSHNIWIIPRIKNLGKHQPDEIVIEFQNCGLVDNSRRTTTYSGNIALNQTFEPVEIIMSMSLQHWLCFGSRDLAFAILKKNNNEIGYGYFKLEKPERTVTGDTLYIDFSISEF
jgi:hypothetical protein